MRQWYVSFFVKEGVAESTVELDSKDSMTLSTGSFDDNPNRWLEVGFDRGKVTLGHW